MKVKRVFRLTYTSFEVSDMENSLWRLDKEIVIRKK